MIILIKKNKLISILIILMFIFSLIITIYIKLNSLQKTSVSLDEEVKALLLLEIKQIFNTRNRAILEKKSEILKNIYNRDLRNGRWAHAHELKKLNYLHQWSKKQGVKFTDINSHVIVRRLSKQGEKYRANLMVSTEYQYNYQDSDIDNICRIGTYHSLDLMESDQKLVISREWYTDPFADSLHMDSTNSEQVKEIVLSKKKNDLSGLSEKRMKAVSYIDRYCGAASLPKYGFQYNNNYKNFNHLGGDCANFASQMLHEGGGFPKDGTWNYYGGSGSRAWVNAHAFNNYMNYSGRASQIARGSYTSVLKASYKLLPGDYIAYEKKGKVVHISVVSGRDSRGYTLVNSHNTDRYRVPWDLGWSNSEIKFRLMRVHY